MTYDYNDWLKNGKPKIFCKCKCGEEIIIKPHHKYRGISEYIRGHCRRGTHITEKHKQILRESNLNKICSEITKQKLREINTGKNHPKYGKPCSEETKQKIRIANTGKHNSKESNEKNRQKHISIKRSTEQKQKISGENSWNWQGGISFEPYCKKFNKSLKESIRDRDERICQECGKTEIENGKKLTCHHIHYDKPNCDPDLIALCTSCNSKVNGNRDYWEEYFMNKLKERGLCKLSL